MPPKRAFIPKPVTNLPVDLQATYIFLFPVLKSRTQTRIELIEMGDDVMWSELTYHGMEHLAICGYSWRSPESLKRPDFEKNPSIFDEYADEKYFGAFEFECAPLCGEEKLPTRKQLESEAETISMVFTEGEPPVAIDLKNILICTHVCMHTEKVQVGKANADTTTAIELLE